jgi:carboxylesterase type B
MHKHTHTKVYHYEHKFVGYSDPASLECVLRQEALCGVFHSSELVMLFNDLQVDPSSQDHSMAKAFGIYWTNLAKYGTPNVPASPETNQSKAATLAEWPQYSLAGDEHMVLVWPPVAGSNLRKAQCDFWDALPDRGPYS